MHGLQLQGGQRKKKQKKFLPKTNSTFQNTPSQQHTLQHTTTTIVNRKTKQPS